MTKRRRYFDNQEIECAREECKKIFKRKVHNQKYHSKKCCQLATNEKLLRRYHENKKPVKKGRICSSKDCDTILSVYNRDKTCSACQDKAYLQRLRRK